MNPIWQGRKVVVCVGTGGVGKTTVAASLGIAAASTGARTLVMTIDPARRLANALGLTDLGDVEREIPSESLAPYGVELKAPLWVMMPDVKRTFDDLIGRIAPSEEKRQAILRNRIYQHFSSALAGSHEYAAVEKLYEVYAAGHYDLIVLDTPPSQNAVDFLDAPGRMLDFLESETLQWFLKPYAISGKLSLKVLDVSSSFILGTLSKLAGSETLREVADFILSFGGMYEGFRQRSRRVRALMGSEELALVLVTGPMPSQHRTMLQFARELHREGLTVRSVVVNRVRRPAPAPAARAAFYDHAAALLDPEDLECVRSALEEEIRLAEIEHRGIDALEKRLGDLPPVLLPELATDVHDLAGLAALHWRFLGKSSDSDLDSD